jgi:hypothetical protein
MLFNWNDTKKGQIMFQSNYALPLDSWLYWAWTRACASFSLNPGKGVSCGKCFSPIALKWESYFSAEMIQRRDKPCFKAIQLCCLIADCTGHEHELVHSFHWIWERKCHLVIVLDQLHWGEICTSSSLMTNKNNACFGAIRLSHSITRKH